jgi:hypothetical protein
MPPTLLTRDANHVTATWDKLFMVVWKRNVTVMAAQTIRNQLKEFIAIVPGRRVALLTVVEQGAPLPSSDARAALANILRSCRDDLICSAVAMEGSGFVVAAQRAVAIGLSMVAKQPFPHRIFASPQQAGEFVAEHFNEGPSASTDEIVRTLEEVRRSGVVPEIRLGANG